MVAHSSLQAKILLKLASLLTKFGGQKLQLFRASPGRLEEIALLTQDLPEVGELSCPDRAAKSICKASDSP